MIRELLCRSILLVLALVLAPVGAQGQPSALQELVSTVVGVKTFINPDARTTENLSRTREGSGVVLDDKGLVLTIG